MEDLFWKQLDIDYPGCDGAMVCAIKFCSSLFFFSLTNCRVLISILSSSLIQVHHGFYTAYNSTSLRSGVLSGIQKAKELYGDTRILVTGHSMGGAMAAFCALDLSVIIPNLDIFHV